MKRAVLFPLGFFALSTLLLSGCSAPSTSGNVYTRDQARTSHSVFFGTILRAEPVVIEGSTSAAGTIGGGALGGALGSAVGSGSGRTIATVAGAVAGAAAGKAAEKSMTTVQGVELEVELDNGELILVVQEADSAYRVGDRVRVIKDAKGTTRVRQ